MGDKAKPDLKESFIWGYQYDDGSLPDDHQLSVINGLNFYHHYSKML